MTENYSSTQTGGAWPAEHDHDHAHDHLVTSQDRTADDDQGQAGAAKEQAAAVGHGAAQAGQQVASVASDQAHNVVAEAGNQAKDLIGQARSELAEQAGAQQKRLAAGLRELGNELEAMTHHSQSPGVATDLARQASTRTHDVAGWLDSREPGQLLQEVQSFARQRPTAFLALAAGAGLLAGRLGRGVKDASGDDASSEAGAASAPAVESTDRRESSLAPSPTPLNGRGADAESFAERPFASSQDGVFEAAHSRGDQW
jgi:hypothetical protein